MCVCFTVKNTQQRTGGERGDAHTPDVFSQLKMIHQVASSDSLTPRYKFLAFGNFFWFHRQYMFYVKRYFPRVIMLYHRCVEMCNYIGNSVSVIC